MDWPNMALGIQIFIRVGKVAGWATQPDPNVFLANRVRPAQTKRAAKNEN